MEETPYLHLDCDGLLQIKPEEQVGLMIAALGATGSGKSNTVRRYIEQSIGFMPYIVVDPHGEYYTLKERFDVIVAGVPTAKDVDLHIQPENGADLAAYVYERGLSLVLNLLTMKRPERALLLSNFFDRFWSLAMEHEKPYGIVLEEAHNFIPQDANPPCKETLISISSEGRKFGLSVMLSSQRAPKIDKDVLGNASLVFFHRVNMPNDIKSYLENTPHYITKQQILALKVGETVVKYEEEAFVTKILKAETTHKGATPKLGISSAPLRAVNDALLTEMRGLLTLSETETSDQAGIAPVIEEFRRQIAEAEARIVELETEIKRLVTQKKTAEVTHSQGTAPTLNNKTLQQRAAQRVVTAQANTVRRQERGLGRLESQLKNLRGYEREVFIYLLERRGKSFT